MAAMTTHTDPRTAAEIERYAAWMDHLRWQARTDPLDQPETRPRDGFPLPARPQGRCADPRCYAALPHPVHVL